MERSLEEHASLLKVWLPALIVVALAFMLVFIAFGTDSIIPGIHDAFHDFRHGALGMPCH